MIRPYCDADLQTVALLFTQSVHHLASGHYDADQCAVWAPYPPDLNFWRERLAGLKTLVFETNTKLAGFISYEPNGHIDLLYTSPAHSRQGVAAALYREVECELARSGISELFTEASLVARPFFERCGFHSVEEQCVQRSGIAFRRYGMRKSLMAHHPQSQ